MTSHPFWSRGEVRVLNDGSIDEIVTGQVQAVHLEQMDDDHWWLGIYGKDDRRMSIRFHRKGKRIIVTAEDDGDHPSGITLGQAVSAYDLTTPDIQRKLRRCDFHLRDTHLMAGSRKSSRSNGRHAPPKNLTSNPLQPEPDRYRGMAGEGSSLPVKELQKRFKKNGWSHEQVYRESDLAIYRRSKGSTDHYEVIRIRSHDGFPIPGTENRASPAEVYPRSEAWGRDGFTFNSLPAAWVKLEEMRR